MTPPRKGKLPRLEKHRYQGHAVVFWTNTLEERARGWLTPSFHTTFRELMLHAATREQLFCPAYCLMPDHLHLLWMGLRRKSDQLNAMKFLRTHLEPALGSGREWQHQPHDHVLREGERQRNAFASFCFYTLANPVRDELVKKERDWPYSGAIVPGYPDLHPLDDSYWKVFWKLYVAAREAEPPPFLYLSDGNSTSILPLGPNTKPTTCFLMNVVHGASVSSHITQRLSPKSRQGQSESPPYASTSLTTLPWTSVRRKSRP